MKIALLLGRMSLGSRESVDIANFRTTPGMTGTDTGFVRIGEELERLGHEVTRLYATPDAKSYDLALAINEPDLLRDVRAGVKLCATWLNDFSFCRVGFERHVDRFLSPSRAHLKQFRTRESWRRVEVSPEHPGGKGRYHFDESKWTVVPLGCDPERFTINWSATGDPSGTGSPTKIPGRCIYASSPDRGLHWLLQEWPAIKRAVPHATLHIFYRLAPWIESLASVPPFPSIEALRARAVYIREALNRFARHPDNLGVVVRDSVSKEEIEQEMARAECLAYPCDTIRWSEGFSCTLLEGCAARACPVTLETDALPDVYGDVVPMAKRDEIGTWREVVQMALTDQRWRDATNDRCRAFAEQHTWEHTARAVLRATEPTCAESMAS